jgi:RimJ/RimL family protein N-acetyltransferase
MQSAAFLLPRVLTFRKADESDIATLRSLAQRIWRECYPAIIGSTQVEYMLELMYAPETIRREMSEGVHWELAHADDAPVGFLSLSLDGDGRAKLNKLYLAPELHGRGLGQELIRRACESAAAIFHVKELWLQVNKRNEQAIQAYRRAGFRVEKEAIFDIGNGFVMDDFIMARAVPMAD